MTDHITQTYRVYKGHSFCPPETCWDTERLFTFEYILLFQWDSRYHSLYKPSQWEMMVQCNTISHWLGTYTEWSLRLLIFFTKHSTTFLCGCNLVQQLGHFRLCILVLNLIIRELTEEDYSQPSNIVIFQSITEVPQGIPCGFHVPRWWSVGVHNSIHIITHHGYWWPLSVMAHGEVVHEQVFHAMAMG